MGNHISGQVIAKQDFMRNVQSIKVILIILLFFESLNDDSTFTAGRHNSLSSRMMFPFYKVNCKMTALLCSLLLQI